MTTSSNLKIGRITFESSAKDIKRIKDLEALLAIQLQRSVELTKENGKLMLELERIKKERDCWRKYFKKVKPGEKIPCDREGAMVVYGEVDIDELTGAK